MENLNQFPVLNFPKASLRLSNNGGTISVWDNWRKKYIILTPEEWVRQHLLHTLVGQLGYPSGRVVVEKKINIGNRSFRFDCMVYGNNQEIMLLVECKAPDVPLDKNVLEQIQSYNYKLNALCYLITNGIQHIAVLNIKNQIQVLTEIPTFALLKNYL